jgi:hypothetical protein
VIRPSERFYDELPVQRDAPFSCLTEMRLLGPDWHPDSTQNSTTHFSGVSGEASKISKKTQFAGAK